MARSIGDLQRQIDAIPAPGRILVEKKEILAAVTTVTFTGLDGNTDGIYVLEMHIVPAAAVNCNYFLNPNGLITNQEGTVVTRTGAFNQTNNTRWQVGVTYSTEGAGAPGAMFTTTKVWARAAGPGAVGLTRRYRSSSEALAGTGIQEDGSGVWTDTSTNITSLVIEANQASHIGIGTTLALYKVDV